MNLDSLKRLRTLAEFKKTADFTALQQANVERAKLVAQFDRLLCTQKTNPSNFIEVGSVLTAAKWELWCARELEAMSLKLDQLDATIAPLKEKASQSFGRVDVIQSLIVGAIAEKKVKSDRA